MVKAKSIDSKIYDKDYYLHSCLGFEEYKKYKGKKVHERISRFLDHVSIYQGVKLLDLGCGRGDLAIESARRGAEVIGVDYSADGIEIANNTIKIQTPQIRRKVTFYRMDAKKLKFNDNSFDIITSFDVFEHLYKKELEISMKEISRVLKPGGILLVHTETNKIYLDFTHRVWSYPLDKMLTSLNFLLTRNNYPGLSKDPRNELHKKQHVNEPTYYYLKNLFKHHNFTGQILSHVPSKPIISWKDRLHNLMVSFLPFSKIFPLHILFAHDYICIMKNNKPA